MNTENKSHKSESQNDKTDDVVGQMTEQSASNAAEAETINDRAEQNVADPLTELQSKYDNLNDKYLRLYSEFENYRKRTSKEKIETMRTVGGEILKSFLPIADDFDRAIAGNENDTDIESIKEGFKLIHHKLMHIMESKGLKPMNSMEQVFDTEYHEAITNIPAPNESLKGKVVDVAEKGYFYYDQVLRYAKVVVGQ